MKIIVSALLCVFILAFPVCAEEKPKYQEKIEDRIDLLDEYITPEVNEYLRENEINPGDGNWVNSISDKGVFFHIIDFVKTGAKAPLRTGALLLAIIIITAAISAMYEKKDAFMPSLFVVALAAAVSLAVPLWEAVCAAVDAAKGCSVFMLAFVPVFAVIVALSGGTVTSVSMSTLLLSATEAVSSLTSFLILPIMGCYLAVSLCSGISPVTGQSGIGESIRKIATWATSLVFTVFIGILGIQTALNSASDGLAMRTTKFIVGTAVPVAGSALAEATSTIAASMSLIKSSVGIYGIFVLALTVLPIIIELILWRVSLTVCNIACGFLSLPKISTVLKAVDSMLSVLIGIILTVAAMFILSLTVVVSCTKSL